MRRRLVFTGMGLYLAFVVIVHWFDGENLSAEPPLVPVWPVLFFAVSFVPGFSMSLAWVWELRKPLMRKVQFVCAGTALYALLILVGMDSPVGLLLWAGLSSCAWLLLHHRILESLPNLPGKMLSCLLASFLAVLPAFWAMQTMPLADKATAFWSFLSFPVWGWLMGRVVEG